MKAVVYILSAWLLFFRFVVRDEELFLNNSVALFLALALFKVDKSIIVKASLFISMVFFYYSLLEVFMINDESEVVGIIAALISTATVAIKPKVLWNL